MASGTVKFFNASKGFGFIQPDDGGPDVFVHATALERAGVRDLNEGDQVSFEVEEDRRSGKESATNLRVTGSGSRSGARPDQRSQSGY
ncbi:MAG TPA: cold-shock protein, partial [Rubellimicrobium sp.]|nr:cold-shock protein [Rubellimicrobium sp.]